MGDQITIQTLELLLQKQTVEITTGINKTINQVNKKIANNIEKIEETKRRCLYLERKQRKNNVIIFGLKIDETPILLQTLNKLNEVLGVNISKTDINNIYPLGKNSKPPVLLEFISYLTKQELFKDPEKLKALKGTGISISHDLCQEDRQNQKILRKHLKIARDQNKQARIKGQKIEIDNVLYSAKELEEYDETNYTDTESSDESDENDTVESADDNGKLINKLHNVPDKEMTLDEDDKKRKHVTPPSGGKRKSKRVKGKKI